MLKGLGAAAIAPAASVLAARQGWSQGYCGAAPADNVFGLGSVGYHIVTAAVVILVSDFWEFYYHYLGHRHKIFWEQHKHHHKFFNPSPFAVIADEFVDQFFRALPMFLFPLMFPINIDMMFFIYGVFFYAYGCYLHWGYETDWPDAHHPVLNTAFQHYCHHARAIMGKPYHCGFFFKCWDQLFGSTYDGPCFCVKCEKKKGKRSRATFDKVVVPNYRKLLEARFWLRGGVLSGALSKDVNDEVIKSSVAGAGKDDLQESHKE
jgi:lathosterol oxidase